MIISSDSVNMSLRFLRLDVSNSAHEAAEMASNVSVSFIGAGNAFFVGVFTYLLDVWQRLPMV